MQPPYDVSISAEVVVEWRGDFSNDEANGLHADAFEHDLFDDDWRTLVDRHSLGWVAARRAGSLVGFVNVVWDGSVHAWIQDVMVTTGSRRLGIGRRVVERAVEVARGAGCEWLHVDFDDDLTPFYYGACGFRPTNAGLVNLRG